MLSLERLERDGTNDNKFPFIRLSSADGVEEESGYKSNGPIRSRTRSGARVLSPLTICRL